MIEAEAHRVPVEVFHQQQIAGSMMPHHDQRLARAEPAQGQAHARPQRVAARRERIAAATVLAGKAQPADTRDSLAESLIGDREPVVRLLREARSAARANTGKLETRWAASRMQRFHTDGVRLSDADAARLLVASNRSPFETNSGST